MATTPVAPPAPSAAPAAPSAPAAPASSTPTPAAPAAPATPVTPAAPTETPSMGERISQGWDKAKAAVNLETGEVTEPEVPAVPDPNAPPELADDAVNPAPDPNAAPTEVAEEEFKLNFGDDDTTAPAPDEFSKNLTPEQKAFFDANPELKGQVFGSLRRDAENREIRQYIPDLETAQRYTKAAGAWETIDGHFLEAAESPEGPAKFLDHWVREALELGDDGKPVLDADGKYKVHPSLPAIMDHITTNKLKIWGDAIGKQGTLPQEFAPIVDALGQVAKLKGDERLQAAVDVIREVMSPSSPGEGEIPDNLKPFVSSLKAQEKSLKEQREALDRRQREGREATHFESIDRAEDTAAKSVQSQLKPRLAKSGLSEKQQEWAMRDIGASIDDKLGHKGEDGAWTAGSHPTAALFQSRYDSICRQEPGPEREKALQKHILTATNEIIGDIYSSVVKDATKPALDTQTDRQARVDKQTQVSKAEPRGTSAAPASASGTKLTDGQLRAKITSEYKAAHGGDEPDREHLIKAGWEFRKNEAAAAAGVGRR